MIENKMTTTVMLFLFSFPIFFCIATRTGFVLLAVLLSSPSTIIMWAKHIIRKKNKVFLKIRERLGRRGNRPILLIIAIVE